MAPKGNPKGVHMAAAHAQKIRSESGFSFIVSEAYGAFSGQNSGRFSGRPVYLLRLRSESSRKHRTGDLGLPDPDKLGRIRFNSVKSGHGRPNPVSTGEIRLNQVECWERA